MILKVYYNYYYYYYSFYIFLIIKLKWWNVLPGKLIFVLNVVQERTKYYQVWKVDGPLYRDDQKTELFRNMENKIMLI